MVTDWSQLMWSTSLQHGELDREEGPGSVDTLVFWGLQSVQQGFLSNGTGNSGPPPPDQGVHPWTNCCLTHLLCPCSGPNRGHYITIVKSHGFWLLFDDDIVEVRVELHTGIKTLCCSWNMELGITSPELERLRSRWNKACSSSAVCSSLLSALQHDSLITSVSVHIQLIWTWAQNSFSLTLSEAVLLSWWLMFQPDPSAGVFFHCDGEEHLGREHLADLSCIQLSTEQKVNYFLWSGDLVSMSVSLLLSDLPL